MRSLMLWPLLRLGHGGFVADICDTAFEQHVHQRGFADVGDAHDHHAQRLVGAVAMRCQRLAQPGNLRGIAGILAAQRHRIDAGLLVEKIQPCLRDDGIGKVRLVEYLQAWALAQQTQLGDQRVAARLWQARVQHFYDNIDELHRLGRFSARRGHVTREPLYRHLHSTN